MEENIPFRVLKSQYFDIHSQDIIGPSKNKLAHIHTPITALFIYFSFTRNFLHNNIILYSNSKPVLFTVCYTRCILHFHLLGLFLNRLPQHVSAPFYPILHTDSHTKEWKCFSQSLKLSPCVSSLYSFCV